MRLNRLETWVVVGMAMLVGLSAWAPRATADDADGGEKPVLAGPDDGAGKPGRGDRSFGGDRKGERGDRLMRVIDELELDEATEAKVREIVAEHSGAMMANRREIGKLMQQAKEAKEAGDDAAALAAREKIKALREEGGGPRDMIEKISGLLNDEQQAKLKELAGKLGGRDRGPGGRANPAARVREAMGGLDLTPEQKAKIDARIHEFESAMQSFREEHGEEIKALHQEARAAREAGNKEAAREVFEKMKALHQSAPAASMRSLHEDLGALLTDDQKQQLRERMMKRMRDGEGPRRGDRARRGPGGEDGEKGERKRPRGERKRGERQRGGDKPADDAELDL